MSRIAKSRVPSSTIYSCAASAAALVLGSAYASGQTQLLLNPSFAVGVNGTPSAAGGDVAMSTGGPWLGWNNWVAPYSGFYSTAAPAHTAGGQVGKTFSAPNGGIYQFPNVTQYDAYTASVWFYNLSTDALQPGETEDVRFANWYSGTNGTGSLTGGNVNSAEVTMANAPSNTWTYSQVQAAAPAGTQSIQWMAFFQNPLGLSGAMYASDASLLDTSWNGGGTTNNWSDNNNWGGGNGITGIAPAQYAPVVFAGSGKLNSVNDTTSGTPYYGIAFTPAAGSYTITGNQANLASDVNNYSTNLQTLALPLGLQQATNFNAQNGNITVSGSINGAFAITKTGANTLTLSGSNSYGDTNVTAGTLVIGNSSSLPATTNVNITAGTMQLATSIGGPTIASLAISGNGTLDINNDHLFINYGSNADPISSIQALLVTGRNGGSWNGAGGITSSAIASNPGYAVGYADSADAGNPAGLASGTIEIAFTLLGDANLDHSVNGVDFGILAANFNKGVTSWDQGDFNYDNVVNGVDFGSLAANFNKGAASASDIAALDAFAASNGLLADVPEPASVGLLLLGTASLLSRRHRSKTGE
jgi:autotransporter-associated beta strand protein